MLRQPAIEPGAAPASAASPALRLTGVTRVHGSRAVWAPLDLRLDPGTLTLVTGPNGSGKTTLLRLAAGLLRPSAGSRDCSGRALYIRGGAGLRSAQTVREAVSVIAGLSGRRAAVPAALSLLGLLPLEHQRVGTLSAGERIRAALAAGVACGPALLCLDEPTAALDGRGLRDLAAVLAALRAGGGALLVATHQPETLAAGADAEVVLRDGRVMLR